MPANTKPFLDYSTGSDGVERLIFGFELKNIRKNLSGDVSVLQQNALRWHKHFFNAISKNRMDCTVWYKIQNPNTPSKPGQALRIAFLFCIRNAAAHDKSELSAFINGISLLFEPKRQSPSDPYAFTAISSAQDMKQLSRQPAGVVGYNYIRKPVFLGKTSGKLGYNRTSAGAKTAESFPQFFAPDFLSINNVLQYIAEAGDYVDLSLFLSPLDLSQETINNHKQLVKDLVPVSDNFTRKELHVYKQQQEALLDDSSVLFSFSLSLNTGFGFRFGQTLHNAIADAFYGNINNVEVQACAAPGSVPFAGGASMDDLLRHIYTQEQLMYCFRLPVTVQDDILWFPHQINIFNYLPPDLPEKGITLGIKRFLNTEKKIRITEKDLSAHIYILGQTGVGKTTLMKTMIADQIKNGEGLCVVDPHGDLVQQILESIPPERKDDVIYFDPTTTKDFFINIIEVNPDFPEQRTFIFNELMKFFSEVYNLSIAGGPMFELYFKYTLFLLIEKGYTLKEFFQFYFDRDFRKELIEFTKLDDVRNFFNNAESISGELSFNSFAPYITSKINRFVLDDFIGPVISNPKTSINFREVIDKRKILLVRLPKGRLSDEGASFIGTVIFNRIIMAAYTRENINEAERVPFNLFVDEFQNFTSSDLITALAESRKYKLRLILANQTLAQLNENTVNLILGNVGSQIFFRPGVMDAIKLYPYYKHDISESEMLYMPNYQAVARIMNNFAPTKPFIFETIVG